MMPKKYISQIDKNCAILVKNFRFKNDAENIFKKAPVRPVVHKSDIQTTEL